MLVRKRTLRCLVAKIHGHSSLSCLFYSIYKNIDRFHLTGTGLRKFVNLLPNKSGKFVVILLLMIIREHVTCSCEIFKSWDGDKNMFTLASSCEVAVRLVIRLYPGWHYLKCLQTTAESYSYVNSLEDNAKFIRNLLLTSAYQRHPPYYPASMSSQLSLI